SIRKVTCTRPRRTRDAACRSSCTKASRRCRRRSRARSGRRRGADRDRRRLSRLIADGRRLTVHGPCAMSPLHDSQPRSAILRRMKRPLPTALCLPYGASVLAAQAPKHDVEPLWPKPFPVAKHWILGSVTGVSVDAQDRIWVVHRGVDSLQANEKGPTLEPW